MKVDFVHLTFDQFKRVFADFRLNLRLLNKITDIYSSFLFYIYRHEQYTVWHGYAVVLSSEK